jgi:hypothetical protein
MSVTRCTGRSGGKAGRSLSSSGQSGAIQLSATLHGQPLPERRRKAATPPPEASPPPQIRHNGSRQPGPTTVVWRRRSLQTARFRAPGAALVIPPTRMNARAHGSASGRAHGSSSRAGRAVLVAAKLLSDTMGHDDVARDSPRVATTPSTNPPLPVNACCGQTAAVAAPACYQSPGPRRRKDARRRIHSSIVPPRWAPATSASSDN